MSDPEHVRWLGLGRDGWNEWRKENPNIRPNFSGADLSGGPLPEYNLSNSDLSGASLNDANLSHSDLRGAKMISAFLLDTDLTEADLTCADLTCANLMRATLCGALLDEANLTFANLTLANLTGAKLRSASLVGAFLVEANLQGVDISNSQVYGASVWKTNLTDALQLKLIVTPPGEPCVTVDHLDVAQFMALVAQNRYFRQFLDTVTTKIVLLLGRFSDGHKMVLNALKIALSTRDFVPVLFDFDPSTHRNKGETIRALASMSQFVIADISDPASVPQELGAIIPNLPSVPVQLIIEEGKPVYALADDFKHYPWVIKPILHYRDAAHLVELLDDQIIKPAMSYLKATQL